MGRRAQLHYQTPTLQSHRALPHNKLLLGINFALKDILQRKILCKMLKYYYTSKFSQSNAALTKYEWCRHYVNIRITI